MRSLLVTVSLFGILFAGCTAETPFDAHSAYETSRRASQDMELAIFLGLAGTEGDVDVARYRDAVAGTEPGASFASSFTLDPRDAVLGDGRPPAWISTQFVWDQDTDAMGGLFTEISADDARSVFIPFPGVYAGGPDLLARAEEAGSRQGGLGDRNGLQSPAAVTMQDGMLPTGFTTEAGGPALSVSAGPSNEPAQVLCSMTTTTASWLVGAEEAAAVASEDPTFAAHVADHPEGEWTYHYMPGIVLEAGCPTNQTIPSNFWRIQHTDLDAHFAGKPTMVAEVTVDAATGAVLASTVLPFGGPLRIHVSDHLIVDDPLLVRPDQWVSHDIPLEVPVGIDRIAGHLHRGEAPDHMVAAETRIVDPAGRVVFQEAFDGVPLHEFDIAAPLPGPWTVQYRYQTAQPLGHHDLSYVWNLTG